MSLIQYMSCEYCAVLTLRAEYFGDVVADERSDEAEVPPAQHRLLGGRHEVSLVCRRHQHCEDHLHDGQEDIAEERHDVRLRTKEKTR